MTRAVAVLADTSMLVAALRGLEPGRSIVARGVREGLLATCTVVEAELWAGVDSEERARGVRRLLAGVPVLRFDRGDARAAALPLRVLGPHHEADALIAGAALARRLAVLTGDAAFRRVPGLRVLP